MNDKEYRMEGRDSRCNEVISIINFYECLLVRDSVGRVATRYGLDGPGIEFRRGARFSVPVQTGPGTHPASSKMRTGSLSRG
jgi:hypothetical protein